MKVQVGKRGSTYIADCIDLPGSPPIGIAITQEGAITDLLYKLLGATYRVDVSKPLEIISWFGLLNSV